MARPKLSDEQRIAWLRLARSERVGAISFHHFINRFGSASAALDALPDMMRRSGSKTPLYICSESDARRELEQATRLGIRHIAYGEPDYPSLLRESDGNPPFLLVQGSNRFDERPHVAIVGSRNASVSGMKLATRLAHDLSEAGYGVVSGLARGIDTAAHRASLKGGSIAVIAGGHLHLYPPENKPLATEMIEQGGAIVSEMPANYEPRGQDFPRRNRIISGLCLGVVIVEAAQRSGSLITARLAGEQGRQVFAIPGSPLDPRATGTNNLIREGATLVRSAEDIMHDLRAVIGTSGHDSMNEQMPFRLETSSTDTFDSDIMAEDAIDIVLQGLSHSPVDQDDIIRFSQLAPSVVVSCLCELEVSGRVTRIDGNRFVLQN